MTLFYALIEILVAVFVFGASLYSIVAGIALFFGKIEGLFHMNLWQHLQMVGFIILICAGVIGVRLSSAALYYLCQQDYTELLKAPNKGSLER